MIPLIVVQTSDYACLSPGQGAMFSLLALQLVVFFSIPYPHIILTFVCRQDIIAPNITSSTRGDKSKTGVIAGSIVGCLVGLTAIGVFVYWFVRRRRRARTVRVTKYMGDRHTSLLTPPILSEHTRSEFDHEAQETNAVGATSSPPQSSTPSQAIPGATTIVPVPNLNISNKRRMLNDESRHDIVHAVADHPRNQNSGSDDLRNELENLRREMERIRGTHVTNEDEAPPSYDNVASP